MKDMLIYEHLSDPKNSDHTFRIKNTVKQANVSVFFAKCFSTKTRFIKNNM